MGKTMSIISEEKKETMRKHVDAIKEANELLLQKYEESNEQITNNRPFRQKLEPEPEPSEMIETLRSNGIELKVCLLCGKPIGEGAISFCYDSQWKHNCWGGDTHEILGTMHEECVEEKLQDLGELP